MNTICRKAIFFLLLVFTKEIGTAQDSLYLSADMDEIIISSERIDLPFAKNSRSIHIISASDIAGSTATNVADLLQDYAGLDIRRRGVEGMQSDIYIRGGHFNQVLILIDGIKVENPQTGHHTMNVFPPLENIQRIEIIKGPAARVYGQNAFSGAINIVTKDRMESQLGLQMKGGSYDRLFLFVSAAVQTAKSNHQLSFSNKTSSGYRPNTDFENRSYFLKSKFSKTKLPIVFIANFQERKFGANNFYTNSPAFDEYEETQSSIVALATRFEKAKWRLKPKVFWKRSQDMFLLKRGEPSFSRNFNIANKVGGQVNASYASDCGITGMGIELAQIWLASNNLGNQQRSSIQSFLEHRFSLLDDRLDITPGVSINYFSDFKFHAFPGLDIGYALSAQVKVFGNIGYSYRVPTYTELFINIPNFLSGNEKLQPEKAFAQEVGMSYRAYRWNLQAAFFRREAHDLIDYIKKDEDSPHFIAQNLRQINTLGFELQGNYDFSLSDDKQSIGFGYTYLHDDYQDVDVFASRYLLNTSMKHQFLLSAQFSLWDWLGPSIAYRYIERPSNSYQVLDVSLRVAIRNFSLSVNASNLLDVSYFEKENVPMPGRNVMVGVGGRF